MKTNAEIFLKLFLPAQLEILREKFSKHYVVWQFHKDSQTPLIKEIINLMKQSRKSFQEAFPSKRFSYQFVQIAHCLDSRNVISIPHRDGYWYDGQFHLTVLGNANVSVWPGERESKIGKKLLWFENGSFWYLNGSKYYHTINKYSRPTKNNIYERIEILIPLDGIGNQKEKEELAESASKDKDRFFYPDNTKFIQLKKSQVQYALKAYSHKKASSPKPIGFIHNIKSIKNLWSN